MSRRRGGTDMAGRLGALVNLQADAREEATVATTTEAAELRARVREALAAEDPSEATIDDATAELAGLVRGVRAIKGEMLAAGRALVRLQATVGRGGYRALLRAGLVPYAEDQASRLRDIARAVDGGVLPEAMVPRALSAAYAAAKLPPPAVERLVRDGVLRPEATARQIREAVEPPSRDTAAAGSLTDYERQRLERRLAWHLAEAERIRARLAEG